MITAKDIMRDADVAKLAGIALDTFQRSLRDGIKAGDLDWFAAKPMTHGRRRFWFRPDVERVITERIVKTEQEVEK